MKTAQGPVSSTQSGPHSAAPTPAPAPVSTASPGLTGLRGGLSGGSPLPADLRSRMESGFGTSFADVRVHTGAAAAQATGQLRAEAFATGPDIAFAPGRYRPGSQAGQGLIAHELAHVLQQRRSGGGGAVQAKSLVSTPGDAAETAADSAAATVMAGGRAQVGAVGQSLRGRIMRRAMAGMGALSLSPAASLAPARPGAVAPGAGPVLTPMMTAQVSAAGGAITGLAKGTTRPGDPAPTAKAPDDAQTARGENPAEAAAAPSVGIAGAPAGAAAEPEAAQGGKKKDKKRKGEREDKAKGAASEEAAAPARIGGGGGGGGTKRFGQNLGDRGEAAADEARERLTHRAHALETNEGAGTRIGAARAAAEPAPTAADADGQRQQAGTLAEAPVASPDTATAGQNAKAALNGVAPTTIEELDDFSGPAGAATRDGLAQSVASEAAGQATPVQTAMAAVRNPPPGAAPPAAMPQPDPIPAPASAAPDLAAASPAPVPEESLDASEFKDSADTALAEHDVDDATLARADEGPLREIGTDKTKLNENVDGAASDARATESAATGTATAELAASDAQSGEAMQGGRHAGQEAVSAEQQATRGTEETGSLTLAEQINALYSTAEGAVNEKLASLESDAVQAFREKQGARVEAFATNVRAELSAFKSRRYRGARGLYRRGRDWLLSINSLPEVKALYERNRQAYIADIDAMLSQIKDSIQTTIDGCKTTLAEARTAIDQLVESNKGQLDTEAQAALTRARQQFGTMEARIESTRRSALAALDRERERAIREMDAKLAEIQAENAGLVDRIAAAIKALAQLLGQFMALLARVTRMGVGTFLGAAGSQAREGVRNNLWDQLQEAFKQWFFNKVPGLQLMMNLPPNWLEMMAVLATSLIGLLTENLPAMLPAIGIAAMTWLATQLALKLIPGAGAIMAVIDAIRAAWGLVQSLFSAAGAFLEFVMQVAARGNGAVAFARALAHGIVAAVDMVLTFLGVDALIKRVLGAILRPFQRIIARLQQRFRQFMQRRRSRSERGGRDRKRRRDDGDDRGGDAHARRSARDRADRDRREGDRRQRDRERGQDPRRNRQTEAERRRRREEDEARRRRERRDEAVRNIGPSVDSLLGRGVSRLRLRAQLGLWRLRYRLRKLALEDTRVVAGNSDDVTVRQVLRDNPEGVYRMVHDIGRDRFRRAEARNAARPAARRGALDVQPGDDPTQLGANLQNRPASAIPRTAENPERAGGGVPLQVGGTTVPAQQGFGPAASPAVQRNLKIPGLGSYPEITAQLAAEGLQGPAVTQAIQQALRTGQGSPTIMRLIALMFGREVLQSQSSAATSVLALQAMGGGAPTGTIFGQPGAGPVQGTLFGTEKVDPEIGKGDNRRHVGGGVAPFSPVGAAADQRRAEAAFDSDNPSALNTNTDRGRRAQAEMLRTVELVYHAVLQMEFRDTTGLRREILRLFDMFDRASGVRG
ncbi:DUF4157 domain-containing protein [Paracoccus litorisediminis]|uniref:eCIS core domain-containing protein n=1 Tax=Paracoccus litorisediminis TaxID=2006130 RepID=UPI00372F2694